MFMIPMSLENFTNASHFCDEDNDDGKFAYKHHNSN